MELGGSLESVVAVHESSLVVRLADATPYWP